MFKLLLSMIGGAILLLIAIVTAIGIFIYRIRPVTPGATVGFSPQQLIQAPTIFIPNVGHLHNGLRHNLPIPSHR